MRLDRAWIEAHIPHQGRMCLLDEVMDWDLQRIRCRSGTHRAADHPLRAHGRLGIASAIEYAAQAMAVHGALLGGAAGMAVHGAPTAGMADTGGAAPLGSVPGKPAAGFLASVRGARFHVARLDDVPGDLLCSAQRLAGDGGTALYEFELRCGTGCLLTGRATVILDANLRWHP